MAALPSIDMSFDIVLNADFDMKIAFVLGAMSLPPEKLYNEAKQANKDFKGDQKKQFDKFLNMVCKGFLQSPDYKSGDTSKADYKICCEMVDYCSFYKQPWFFMVGAAALGLLIYLISMTIVGVCLLKKKRGGGGGPPPKTPKTGKSTGKPPKNNKKK